MKIAKELWDEFFDLNCSRARKEALREVIEDRIHELVERHAADTEMQIVCWNFPEAEEGEVGDLEEWLINDVLNIELGLISGRTKTFELPAVRLWEG